MNLPREDVYCPACPDPETAFRIEDVGMKFATEGDFRSDDKVTFKVSRPAWEVVMVEHLRLNLDDEEHRILYDLCVTELMAAGVSAEEAARNSVQGAVDSVRKLMDSAMREAR